MSRGHTQTERLIADISALLGDRQPARLVARLESLSDADLRGASQRLHSSKVGEDLTLRWLRRLFRRAMLVGPESAVDEITAWRGAQVSDSLRELYDGAERATLIAMADPDNAEACQVCVEAWQALLQRSELETAPESVRRLAYGGAANAHWRLFHAGTDSLELERAISLWRRAGAAAAPGSAAEASELANVGLGLWARYRRRGQLEDLAEAIRLAREAAELAPEGTEPWVRRRGIVGVGLRYRYRHTGLLADLHDSISILRSVVSAPVDPDVVATFHNSLVAALRARFEHSRQREDINEAIDVAEQAVDATPGQPAHLTNLAGALYSRFDVFDDIADLKHAIDYFRDSLRLTPASAHSRSGRQLNLATALRALAEQQEDDAALDESLALYGQGVPALSRDAPERPRHLANYGRALALRHLRRRAPEDDRLASAVLAEAIRQGLGVAPEATVVAGEQLGLHHGRQQRWREAADVLESALEVVEQLHTSQPLRAQSEYWLARGSEIPGLLAFAYAQLGRGEQAVVALERSAAVLLDEVMGFPFAALSELEEAGHVREAATLRRTLQRWQEAGRSALADDRSADERLQARSDLERAVASIRRLPGFEDFLYRPTIADVVQATDACPLAYVASSALGAVGVVVEAEGHSKAVELPFTSVQVATVRRRFVAAYYGRHVDRAAWERAVAEVRSWLDQMVIAPILALARADKRLRVVARGSLALLPLHAASPDGRLRARPLVSAVASARIARLTDAREGPGGEPRLLSVDQPAPVTAPPLPYSRAEVTAATRWFDDSMALSGPQATRSEVLRLLPEHQVVHLSCHGDANLDQPLESSLLLANDQRLVVRDLALATTPKLGLVVLSACETAMTGGRIASEGMSFPTALLVAGAAAAIGTLWAVSGAAACLVLARFYALWRGDGLAPEAALRAACVSLEASSGAERAELFVKLGIERRRAELAAGEVLVTDWSSFVYVGGLAKPRAMVARL